MQIVPHLYFAESSDPEHNALLFYEGEHQGQKFNASKIKKIFNATLNWLKDGQRKLRLFKSTTPHMELGIGNIIGEVFNIRLEEITEALIPSDAFSDLVGRMGIFATIRLNDVGQATKESGILDTLSVGMIQDAIYEVSTTPVPVLPAAMLFSLEKPDWTFAALQLAQVLQDRQLFDVLHEYWNTLTAVLAGIRDATPEQIAATGKSSQELSLAAVEDYLQLVKGRLELLKGGFSMTTDAPNSIPETEQVSTEILTLERSSEAFQTDAGVQLRFSLYESKDALQDFSAALQPRVLALVAAGRIKQSDYEEYFSPLPAVATFSVDPQKGIDTYAERKKMLEKVEFLCTHLENTPSIVFGMPVGGTTGTAEQAELEAAANFARTRPLASSF